MDKIPVNNVFAAVFDKSVLDPLLAVLDKKSVRFWGTEGTVKYLKSRGFSAHSVVRGFDFDGRVKSLDRVNFIRILADRTKKSHMIALRKELSYSSSGAKRSREVASSILSFPCPPEAGPPLAEKRESRTGSRIYSAMRSSSFGLRVYKYGMTNSVWEPFDLVIVDLYAPDKKNFPESMDIGGQALIRAAVKNYKNVAVAFDARNINEVASEIKKNNGSTTLSFRKKQAKFALKFIADRGVIESKFGL